MQSEPEIQLDNEESKMNFVTMFLDNSNATKEVNNAIIESRFTKIKNFWIMHPLVNLNTVYSDGKGLNSLPNKIVLILLILFLFSLFSWVIAGSFFPNVDFKYFILTLMMPFAVYAVKVIGFVSPKKMISGKSLVEKMHSLAVYINSDYCLFDVNRGESIESKKSVILFKFLNAILEEDKQTQNHILTVVQNVSWRGFLTYCDKLIEQKEQEILAQKFNGHLEKVSKEVSLTEAVASSRRDVVTRALEKM